MGKKSSPSAPPPPEQSEFRISQFTPYGNLLFGRAVPAQARSTQPVRMQPIQSPQRFDHRMDAGGSAFYVPSATGQVPGSSLGPEEMVFDKATGSRVPFSQFGGGGGAPVAPGGGFMTRSSGNLAGFEFDPSSADAAAYVEETPFQRSFREQQQDIATILAESSLGKSLALGASPFPSTADLPDLPDFTSGEGRQRAEDAAMSRSRRLLDPVFERRENRLQQDIANRGQYVAPGTAGGQEFEMFEDARNRAYQDAADAAVEAGMRASGLEFGQAQAARGQLLGERTGLRQQMFNELLAALTGQQQAGGYQPSQGFQMPDPAQSAAARQAADMAAFNAANQRSLGNQSGLFNLAGAGLGGWASAGFPFCWVAREVYGADNPRWLEFRHWMLTRAPAWLVRLYSKHGPAVARWLHDKPRAKSALRFVMDRVI